MCMKELRKKQTSQKQNVGQVSRKSGLLFEGLYSFGLQDTLGKGHASKAHWSSGATGNISDYF